MFVHSVYFWLKDDLSAEEKESFLQGVNSLTTIETVRQSHVGVPAPTDRPIIERSYSYALIVAFDGQEGHDQYQIHETHDKFRDNCSAYWKKVLIFDSIG